MPQLEISDLRFTAIWVETNLAFVGAATPPNTPLAFLGRPFTYWPRVERLARGEAIPEALELPWYAPENKLFWNRYLNKRSLTGTTGKQAWKALVPLRAEVPVRVRAPWLNGRLFLEAFFYPYGFGFVFTALIQEQLGLEKAVNKAFEVCRDGAYQVSRPDGNGLVTLKMERMAQRALDALRELAYGANVSAGPTTIDPFTIATVVRGAGVDADASVDNSDPVHRALEALTTWYPDYRHASLPELDDVRIPLRQRSPHNYLLYSRRRGRAVWFPAAFLQDSRDKHTLACFHRNLVFAALQVESLGGLVEETVRWLDQGKTLPTAHRECAQNAVHLLYSLYQGNDDTYRSHSPKVHIDQNNLMSPINQVRTAFGYSPLT